MNYKNYQPSQINQQYKVYIGQTTQQNSINEDEYISQFLSFNSLQKPQKQQKYNKSLIIKQFDNKSQQSQQYSQIYNQNQYIYQLSSDQQKIKRSSLHNFQKHFVTTIRRIVKLQWPSQLPPYLQLAQTMWYIFKNSKKHTKQFISLIIGQRNHQVDQKLLKKYKLFEYINQYNIQQYHQAQSYLHSKVLQTFKSTPKQKLMYGRRLSKKQQFANYFYKILQQLDSGLMNKRLPKKSVTSKKNYYQKIKSSQNITYFTTNT